MSRKERDQIAIFEHLKKKAMSQKEASTILGLTLRQVKRKHKKYKENGADGLIHKSRGRPGNRGLKEERKREILAIMQDALKGFGPTFAAEKLLELHSIKISNEALRQLMLKNNLWESKKKKSLKKAWRERKHCVGELIQIDGSEHLWFNNEYWTLVAYIDDATSRIMFAEFAKQETTESLGLSTKKYIQRYGRPVKVYTDRGKVYKVNNGVNRKKTQYQRMLGELDIEISHAYSPQAKGRIERLFKTLQDRLVKELSMQNICDVENANKYLQEIYISKHNQKYAVEPLCDIDAHRSADGYDFNAIFCIKEVRILKNDNTIVHKNRWFQLEKKQPVVLKRNEKITVLIDFDKTIRLMVRGKLLAFKSIAKQPPSTPKEEKKIVIIKTPYKPSRSHPWKVWQESDKGDISKLRKR